MLQEHWIIRKFCNHLCLVTCFLIAPSYETHYSPTNIASLLSSLPTIIKPDGENKITRRSPLNLGYVFGIGDIHHTLSLTHEIETVPHPLSTAETSSVSPSLAHKLSSQATKSTQSQPNRYLAHDHASQHSISKNVADRDQNHGPVNGLVHVTHTLVPTITHVTTTTLSEHGVTKSPTVTVVDHSLVPIAALNFERSHGLSKQSTLTLTPECLTKTMITVNHGQTNQDHILTTVTEHDKDDSSVTHTVVHKVSTLTHDPDPILTHDVSVTHITDGVLVTQGASHKSPEASEENNVFRSHYGGFGAGIDVGGHGSGHGFYV